MGQVGLPAVDGLGRELGLQRIPLLAGLLATMETSRTHIRALRTQQGRASVSMCCGHTEVTGISPHASSLSTIRGHLGNPLVIEALSDSPYPGRHCSFQ